MIYFTNFPYNYYNNYGVIGYEFIYAQQSFWLANLGSFVTICNIKNTDYFYYNIYLSAWSLCLYIISFIKIRKFIKYIKDV
jgi:hypothetical protein